QTWEARTRVLGPDHPDTLESLDTYASSQTMLKHYDEANKLRQQCLEGRRRFGERDDGYLMSLSNRGFDLIEQGLYEKAEPVLTECIRLRTEKDGPKHPELMPIRNNLVVALAFLGRFAEAEPAALEAEALCRELTGPRSWQTLYLQHSRVRVLYGAGKLDEAA